MSNITAVLPCCCEPEEPGNCCTQFPIPLPPSMTIRWTGSIRVTFQSCACNPDVPNFECPCSGTLEINPGIVASGPLVQIGAGCGYPLTSFFPGGQSTMFCPCACSWEDPPGSGQFFQYCQDYPEGCGPFVEPATAGLAVFGADLVAGKWKARISFGIPLTGQWYQSSGLSCGGGYCNHGVIFGSRTFSPLIGEDTIGALIFNGPDLRFCPDGSVDIRSAFGNYSPQAAFSATCSNTIINTWNPGLVTVS